MSGLVNVHATCISVAFLFFCSITPAFADKSLYQPTEEEQQFHRSVQELFARALFHVVMPEDWKITSQAEITDQAQIGDVEGSIEDAANQPIIVDYHIEWTNVSLEQKAQDSTIEKISEITVTSPVSDEQILEYEQLAARIAEAFAINDRETAERLQREMEEKAVVINKAFKSIDEKIAEINQEEGVTDAYAAIYVMGNSFFQTLDGETKSMEIKGYPAFRTSGYNAPPEGWWEGSTIVFLGGRWFVPSEEAALQFVRDINASRTTLQTIIVWIEADQKRAERIIEMIDWQLLAEGIGR